MKAALIVLWTLAAGVVLFLIVRRRIDRAIRDLERSAAERPQDDRDGPPPP
ncbi:hypothetical protein [Methylobacterium nodulans]|uniref:Uncharacterized protein n=1 Tax=Methylobacterium nodulans (strain LMG 21967 / CNCM I-2342 / ORS 2060) TaxID=460265 RepID=B8IDF8_METNO|nr:hypothetical protein [Methylobacterium nodulans]ACL61324.1 conserved hypothetical protein [Methylobacterium nodulans ORS 2060]